MVAVTDPLRELVDLCERLRVPAKERGQIVLSSSFGVEPWSVEFYQILFAISQKAQLVLDIIDRLELDDDIKSEAKNHITTLMAAFGPRGLQTPWATSIENFLSPATLGPLKMLSPQVRAAQQYPKLTPEEGSELLGEVQELLSWLEDHQLSENDFIRQSLIDGLKGVIFRLERLDWLGWGYAVDSLREVIGAYMALERGFPNPEANPTSAAILRKTFGVLKVLYEKTSQTKGLVENGQFLLQAYGFFAASNWVGQTATKLLGSG